MEMFILFYIHRTGTAVLDNNIFFPMPGGQNGDNVKKMVCHI